jgi:hypothetical protein
MTAARTGVEAAVTSYRNEAQNPQAADFGSYASRRERMGLYRQYAANTVFDSLSRAAPLIKVDQKLYKHIRSIYNPVARLIDLEVAKVYGGAIDWTGDLRTGAIPVVGADEALIQAIIRLLKWSNFGSSKSLYVRQGATTGDSFLHVIDDLERQRVRIEVLDPSRVIECTHDPVGNVKHIVISYMDVDEKDKPFRFTLEIDGARFRTYKDDALFSFYRGINGEPIDSWDNPYGFVPVRHVRHKDVGLDYGVPSFFGSLSKINELNDQASLLNDNIRKTVNVTWALIGGVMSGTRDGDPNKRDDVLTIQIPAGGDVKPMVANLDIAGVVSAMEKLTSEIEHDMPQLSLQSIRDKNGDATGVAIRNLYNDAVGLIEEIQGNYDAGLIAALQMGISMGSVHMYKDFRAYDLNSYADGDLDFYLQPRSVFADTLSRREKIELLVQVADKPIAALAMRDMGYSEEDIEEVLMAKEQAITAATRGLMQAAFDGNTDDQNTQDLTNGNEEDPAQEPFAAVAGA